MTQEEKAKRFDEALEKARRYYDEYVSRDNILYVEDMEDMFPELKESEGEDESIRKYLYSFVELNSGVNLPPEEAKKILTWLEKQGEQKETLCDKCKKAQSSHSCQDITALGRCALEKQGEQKPDKVEPKFKVGDWVIDTITEEVEQVIELTGCEYICSGHLIVSFNNQHLLKRWTIQDAKDGDVLATNTWLYVFKYTNNKNLIQFHFNCPINENPYKWCFLFDNCYLGIYIDANIHPATKEQHDILFQKMKEAGYEWDTNKKELKKVEQNSDWSEEDRKIFNGIIEAASHHCYLNQKDIDWLKSLRPRNTWKPSNKQMEAIKDAIEFLGCTNKVREDLKSLYEQLKKLKW